MISKHWWYHADKLMLSLEKGQNKQIKFVVRIVLAHVLTKYHYFSTFNNIVFIKNIEHDTILDVHVQNSKYLCTSDGITGYIGMQLCVSHIKRTHLA